MNEDWRRIQCGHCKQWRRVPTKRWLMRRFTRLGISQRALAQKLKISPTYVNTVLHGKLPCPSGMLKALQGKKR